MRISKLSTYILRLNSVLAVVILVYMIQKRDFTHPTSNEILYFVIYYITPVSLIGFITLGISFAKQSIQNYFLIYFISIATAFYAAEIYIQYTTLDMVQKRRASAKEHKMEFDERTVSEVVSDLRSKDVDAYPFFFYKE